jgi:alkanesulfonate monooxygenase SsuD/methylene tetrahydromethanopterin reductase-like flavin-dependent oxidoreductase (luciferase family)
LKVLSRAHGDRIQLPSPEDAASLFTDSDRAEIAVRSGGVLVGSPDTVRGLLQAVLDETGTTELMLTTPVYGHAARRRSYALVGEIAPLLQ